MFFQRSQNVNITALLQTPNFIDMLFPKFNIEQRNLELSKGADTRKD